MRKICLSLIILSCCLLNGCIVLAGGAVIASAAYVIHDHRSLIQADRDRHLQQEIVKALNQNADINKPNVYVYVTVFYGQVLLTGQAPNDNVKNTAGDIAKSVKGVKMLYNELEISGVSSSLTRLSDSWISTKAKMRLLSIQDLKTSSISINVNNGIIYVMGNNLSDIQARWIADSFDKIDGVQRVVICGANPEALDTRTADAPLMPKDEQDGPPPVTQKIAAPKTATKKANLQKTTTQEVPIQKPKAQDSDDKKATTSTNTQAAPKHSKDVTYYDYNDK